MMKLLKACLTVVAVALSGSAFAAELGDDGLHKTEWMRDCLLYTSPSPRD